MKLYYKSGWFWRWFIILNLVYLSYQIISFFIPNSSTDKPTDFDKVMNITKNLDSGLTNSQSLDLTQIKSQAEFDENIDNIVNKMMNNPQGYINGEKNNYE